MKKTLVLASLLAAFGAASAQSTVTMYGQLQAGLFQNEATSATGAVTKNKLRIDSNNGDNNFGVRGTEGLGNGMTAYFDLRHRFNIENGLTDNNGARPFWHGRSIIGLRGGFGSVEIGRQLTAFQGPVGGIQDPFGVTTDVLLTYSRATTPSQTLVLLSRLHQADQAR